MYKSLLLVLMMVTVGWTAPTAETSNDPKEVRDSAEYIHDKNWLKDSPPAFIAANIRGEGAQYKARRQAALDILVEKDLRFTAPELMQELKRGSFLGDQLCAILAQWNEKRALPLLRDVEKDKNRPAAVREAARKALSDFNKTSASPTPSN